MAVDFPLENLCLTENKKSRSLQLLQAAERYSWWLGWKFTNEFTKETLIWKTKVGINRKQKAKPKLENENWIRANSNNNLYRAKLDFFLIFKKVYLKKPNGKFRFLKSNFPFQTNRRQVFGESWIGILERIYFVCLYLCVATSYNSRLVQWLVPIFRKRKIERRKISLSLQLIR